MGIFRVAREEKQMTVSVKKLTADAVLPKKAKESDAGYDIVAIDDGTFTPEGYVSYRTGLSISPPKGYHVLIFPRSSISNYDLVLANSVGLVDNGYRGEIMVRFKPVDRIISSKDPVRKIYKKGDKIAQLVFEKTISFEMQEVNSLDDTDRGSGGFGSSGN